MLNERHQTKHFAETLKDNCDYCHRTPAIWQYAGSEKVCAHCGTRVYNSTGSTSGSLLTKSSHR